MSLGASSCRDLGVSMMRVFATYEDAAEALAPGETVCGTFRGEEPVYFLMPESSGDVEMRRASFSVRHGRSMSSYEEFLLGAAQQLRERGVQ